MGRLLREAAFSLPGPALADDRANFLRTRK
jgi:hypothetical protein